MEERMSRFSRKTLILSLEYENQILKSGTFCTHFSNVHTCNNFTLHELLNMVGLENYNFRILGGAEKLVRAVTAASHCWA